MSHPHELVTLGAIEDDPRLKQKVKLHLSSGHASKGKEFIKSVAPFLTDQQISGATIAGAIAYPATFALAMPPVGDQGSFGACVPFSVSYYSTSRVRYMVTGASSYSTAVNVFSPEWTHDQLLNGGCSSGTGLLAILPFEVNNGDVLWDTVPYNTGDGCTHTVTDPEIAEAALYKISGYTMTLATDPAGIKAMLFSGRPISFTFTPDYSYFYGHYFDPNNPDYTLLINNNFVWKGPYSTLMGPHANTIVGWDDTKNAWLVVNQWGTSWGDAGYRWIDYDWFTHIAYDMYSIDGFGAPPPPTNNPPVANAGLDQSVTGTTATLNGTGSYDTDGTINGWAWTQVSGPNTASITSASSPITGLTGLITGTYVFKLTVTDDDSATGVALVNVIVTAVSNDTYSVSVTKTTSKGKTTDHVSWSIFLSSSPTTAAIEVSTASSTTGFSTLYTINPFISTGVYNYLVNSKKTRYYRLKIVKSDGSTVYSAVSSIR